MTSSSNTIFEAFPESFNELRRQLSSYHQDIWEKVSFVMVHKQELFIEIMNKELESLLVLPYSHESTIEEACAGWLRALERRKPVFTMTATETIDPRNSDPSHIVLPMHTPSSHFSQFETSNMTEQQLEEAMKKGYKPS